MKVIFSLCDFSFFSSLGFFQNIADFFQCRCFGLLKPNIIDWTKQYTLMFNLAKDRHIHPVWRRKSAIDCLEFTKCFQKRYSEYCKVYYELFCYLLWVWLLFQEKKLKFTWLNWSKLEMQWQPWLMYNTFKYLDLEQIQL